MLESECQMCEDMQQLIATLTLLSQDKAWKLRPEHVQLIQVYTYMYIEVCVCVCDLERVHVCVRVWNSKRCLQEMVCVCLYLCVRAYVYMFRYK